MPTTVRAYRNGHLVGQIVLNQPVTTAPSPPPPPTATDFTAYVRGQAMTAASETAEPVEIETIEWSNTDNENETVYADVLATSM